MCIVKGKDVSASNESRAMLFEQGRKRAWIGRSLITHVSRADGQVEITIPVWLAEKEGFEYTERG